MSKVVEIKKCHECPHYWSREWWHAPFNCSLVKRLWSLPDVIPDWCPLPNVPQVEWHDKQLATITALFQDVLAEQERQVAKHGVQTRSPFEWLAYLTEEMGELSEAICDAHYRGGASGHIHDEAIQVATLALKIAEMAKQGRGGADE